MDLEKTMADQEDTCEKCDRHAPLGEVQAVFDKILKNPHQPLTQKDILSNEYFKKIRPTVQKEIIRLRGQMRVFLGNNASLFFENRLTWWFQIQEMLRIEGDRPDQVQEELKVYNLFIPKPYTLSATLMFEVEDKTERQDFLRRLVGVERQIFLTFDGLRVPGVPAQDQDTQDGKRRDFQDDPHQCLVEKGPQPKGALKTSAVHFLTFLFDRESWQGFFGHYHPIFLEIVAPSYVHKTMLAPSLWEELVLWNKNSLLN
jgi:hypothetical protein